MEALKWKENNSPSVTPKQFLKIQSKFSKEMMILQRIFKKTFLNSNIQIIDARPRL